MDGRLQWSTRKAEFLRHFLKAHRDQILKLEQKKAQKGKWRNQKTSSEIKEILLIKLKQIKYFWINPVQKSNLQVLFLALARLKYGNRCRTKEF
jgi:hypothetical protein